MAPFNGDAFSRALMILLFLCVLLGAISAVSLKYSRDELLFLRSNVVEATTSVDLTDIEEFCQPIEVNKSVQHVGQPRYKKRHRRKRGRRGGLLVKLRNRKGKTPVPSIILSNVQRLYNKMDELIYRINNQNDYKNCCVFCFSETWLKHSHPDSILQPSGFTIYRQDRDPVITKKGKGEEYAF